MIKKIMHYIKCPKEIIIYLMNKGAFKNMDDEKYIKLKYKLIMGEKLNLDNPKKLSEKLQWLKLYDRKDIYTQMVDKYESKKFLRTVIDEKYIIPTYGVYNSFDEIDFDKLPKEFIMKCTHDSGGAFMCNDKEKFDKDIAKKTINKFLKRKYFYIHREWPYKNVKPRIIIEKYLKNKDNTDLIEYNWFCFNGEPKFLMACYGDRATARYNDYYDIDFKKLDFRCVYNTCEQPMQKPEIFDEMLELCKKISKNVPSLRVDFYEVDGKIYIGELTFFHWAGYTKFEPREWDLKLGKLLVLPKVRSGKKNEKK